MSDWNSKFINAYRFATWPYRSMRIKQMQKNGTVPVFALFYHRVADTVPNPWSMTCDQFQEQIDWLEANFEIVDLEECQRRIRSGFNSKPTVAITFDDGYAENCDFALPMLVERRIPVTYFVTTGQTTKQEPFQHDVDRGQPLPVNTIESLRALDMAGVEIGGHTRTHVDLGKTHCPETLVDEVLTATREMEDLIGRKIRFFAFPFGQIENLNPDVFVMLREAGLLGVCSAYGGWNKIGQDEFHIQRIHGDPSIHRIKNWLSYDLRLARIEGYDYSEGIDHADGIDHVSTIQETESRSSAPAAIVPSVDLEATESNLKIPTSK